MPRCRGRHKHHPLAGLTGSAPIPALNQSPIAFVRPQKVAGSFIASLCYRSCGGCVRAAADIDPRKAHSRCCAWCYASWDTHFDFSVWAAANAWLAGRSRPAVLLFTMLRSPIARVRSEYAYAVERLSPGVGSEQWDYINVPHLWDRMTRRPRGNLSLSEWLSWPQNPARERMTRYVNGFRRLAQECRGKHPGLLQRNLRAALSLLRPPLHAADADAVLARWPRHETYGEAPCLLNGRGAAARRSNRRGACPYDRLGHAELALAKRRLSRDFLAFGLVERMDESLALLRWYTGWRVPSAPVVPPTRSEPPIEIKSEIARHNPLDMALFAHAEEVFALRLSERRIGSTA